MDRRFGRAQAPEPHLIMPGTDWRHRPIMVVIRDVQTASACDVGALVESIASAFEADAGGFCRLEIVLCTSDVEVASVVSLDGEGWVVLAGAEELVCAGRVAAARKHRGSDSAVSSLAKTAPRRRASVVSFRSPGSSVPASRRSTPGSLLRRPMTA